MQSVCPRWDARLSGRSDLCKGSVLRKCDHRKNMVFYWIFLQAHLSSYECSKSKSKSSTEKKFSFDKKNSSYILLPSAYPPRTGKTHFLGERNNIFRELAKQQNTIFSLVTTQIFVNLVDQYL